MTHLSIVTYVSKEFETLAQFILGSSSHGTRRREMKMSGSKINYTAMCSCVGSYFVSQFPKSQVEVVS